MKHKLKIAPIMVAALLSFTSCKKDYFEINKNPNLAIAAPPKLVFPEALRSTAPLMVTYQDYGSWVVGYQSGAQGVSFSGTVGYTQQYTHADYNTLFNNAFNNLKNYQYVINAAKSNPKDVLFSSTSRIMKSFIYQMLVDQYGDVPYTDALQGSNLIIPTYDKAPDIYKSCITEINESIALLLKNQTNTDVNPLSTADIMFEGDISKWIKFANNIKLRLLIRAKDSPELKDFVTAEFAKFPTTDAFLLEDVLINPGYSSASDNINPTWSTYYGTFNGSAMAGISSQRVPTPFILGFYNGAKLKDLRRGALIYKNRIIKAGEVADPAPLVNVRPAYSQLGWKIVVNTPQQIDGTLDKEAPAWYTGSGSKATATEAQGIIKSKLAGQPVMLESEIYFLLAEAALLGKNLNGLSDADNFTKGIEASFRYLSKFGSTNAVKSGENPVTDAATYKTNNAGNYLVDYSLASSTEQKLEAIITQKYIALNFIHGHEAWSEFRRTGYPKSDASTNPVTSFRSLEGFSSRADGLPVRLLYPQTEMNLNSNAPVGLSPYNNRIFWDAN
ncbi:MAG: SusD/RagB family nutrient-binding outer membrane lipoprotein [Sphingobacteriaceae bacterium]|nr:SusD/RagB family nutrient-binding outer membrane lipoprotein [Sphingobacteriaceae bacterium]